MSLWNSTQKKKKIGSPQSQILCKRPLNKETSFYTYQKGSYTVEAVVVIPLMAAFLAGLLFFFRILQVQLAVEEALIYAGRKTAVESSVVEKEELLLTSAKAYMLYALKDNSLVEEYIKGGSLGVYLMGSHCEDEGINLRATYVVALPLGFWEIGDITLFSQNYFQKWKGDAYSNEDGDWVYVTENGTVYHLSKGCRVLDLTINEVPCEEIEERRGKDGQKYYACSHCSVEVSSALKVYCTDYGTLYHTKLECTFLKRTISKISREEIGERNPCSYCGEEE